jgi:hypothetical protein
VQACASLPRWEQNSQAYFLSETYSPFASGMVHDLYGGCHCALSSAFPTSNVFPRILFRSLSLFREHSWIQNSTSFRFATSHSGSRSNWAPCTWLTAGSNFYFVQ